MNYTEEAKAARLKVLDLIYAAQTSHIGSNFSCIDIMAVLFSRFDWGKDKFVLSAGWKAASLYYFLWKYGRITQEELESYCQEGSRFIGLAEPITADIPIAGGSMGLGLPGAVGLALAKKIKGESGTVYCLMSDGEIQSGTTWESAQIAAQEELSNLLVLVDVNGFQAMGKTDDILFRPTNENAGKDYPDDLPFFGNRGKGGWNQMYRGNGTFGKVPAGHDFHYIEKALAPVQPEYYLNGRDPEQLKKPRVRFFATIKGKGVSFMENNNLYHYKAPNQEEYEKARAELNHA